jgi:hypothetical protein
MQNTAQVDKDGEADKGRNRARYNLKPKDRFAGVISIL